MNGGAGIRSVPRTVWIAAAAPLLVALLVLATEAWVMLRLGRRPFDFAGAIQWIPWAFLGIALVAVALRWWSGSRAVRVVTRLAVSAVNVAATCVVGFTAVVVALIGMIPEIALAGLVSVVVLLGSTTRMWARRDRRPAVPAPPR